jgi:hypothetical protein
MAASVAPPLYHGASLVISTRPPVLCSALAGIAPWPVAAAVEEAAAY